MSLLELTEPHRKWMKMALREAELAYEAGEVPVGAVVVRGNEVIGRGRNMVEQLKDPTAHAEMIALTAACQTLSSKVLTGCTLYVTLEPCPMCAGAMVWSRIDRLVFGAMDEKAGSAGTLYNIPADRRLNHRIEVLSGIEGDASVNLLRTFFHKKRVSPESGRTEGRRPSPR